MQNIMLHNERGRGRESRQERLEKRKKNIMWQFDMCLIWCHQNILSGMNDYGHAPYIRGNESIKSRKIQENTIYFTC